jgi:hypothetical protein
MMSGNARRVRRRWVLQMGRQPLPPGGGSGQPTGDLATRQRRSGPLT